MRSDRPNDSTYGDLIFPHFGALLHISMRLTKNGHDTTRLIREAMAESFQTWNESKSEEACFSELLDTLTKRFYNRVQLHARPQAPLRDIKIDESLIENNQLFPVVTSHAGRKLSRARESDEQSGIRNALGGLPAPFHPVMYLSFVEGFSNVKIAHLADVRPREIEWLLYRGCWLARVKLFDLLIAATGLETSNAQAMESA